MIKRSVAIVVLIALFILALSGCTPSVVVTFDTNGGSAVESITVGEDFKLPANPTKDGFVFAGWYLDKECTQPYKDVPDASCTLYAKWLSVNWTITLNACGGEVSQTTQTVSVGGSYTLPVAEKQGFYFNGWYDAESGGVQYTNVQGASIANWVEYDDKTLYAQYTAKPVVTFNTNGGSEIAPMYVDETFKMPADPTRTDYEFIGWFTEDNTDNEFIFTSADDITQNITLYAQWRSLKWTLTLNGCDGDVAETTQVVTVGNAYTLPVPQKEGHHFNGWFDSETGGVQYTDAQGASLVKWSEYENKTLYAQYTAIPVVTFNTNGGSEIAPMYADSDFKMPADPIRDGYEFIGWFTENNTDNEFIFTSVEDITESITLYAQWKWIPADILVDDFTGYASTEELSQVWLPFDSTVDLAGGKLLISSTNDYGQAQIELGRDITGLKSFKMTFNTSGNKVPFQVVFNCNDSYSSKTYYGNGEEQTVAFTFDSLVDVENFDASKLGFIIIKLPQADTSITVSKIELLLEEVTMDVTYTPVDEMLYDFDLLADDNALNNLFNAESGPKTLVADQGDGKAMSFEGRVGVYTSLMDWTDFSYIKMDIKTSVNNGFFDFQLTDGANYPYYRVTGNGTWQTAVISLARFEGLNFANVTGLYFTITDGGSAIVDNIELLIDGEEILPQADPEDIVLYDFDDFTDSNALQQVFPSNGGGIATLVEGESGKAMQVSGGQVYALPLFTSWATNHKFISIKYKTSQNNIKWTLSMDDWTGKYPNFELTGNGTWQTAVIDLNRFNAINLNNVTVIYLQANVGSVDIEEIKLLMDGEEFIPQADAPEREAWEDFDYADTAALQAAGWSSDDDANPIQLNTEFEGRKSAVVSPDSNYKSIFVRTGYNWLEFNKITIGFKAPIGTTFTFKATNYTTFPSYLITSTGDDWQEVSFMFYEMEGGTDYSWEWVASIQIENHGTEDLLIDYIDLSYEEADPFYMYDDGIATWQGGTNAVVDERTVVTSTDVSMGFSFQLTDQTTPSSNVFHNVKKIRICAKINSGESVKLYLGDYVNDWTYNLVGTGDWEVYEFSISEMTPNGTPSTGWISCFQFSNWNGNQFYVDYVMLSDVE